MSSLSPMRIAIVCSNYFNIRKDTANGTAIFNYSFITSLVAHAQREDLSITAFASGASELPVKVESIGFSPSSADENLAVSGKHVLYEQTLLSKAFSMQDQFDLYHVNIGDGDIALPFAPFVKRPIVITLHHILDTDYMRKYFSLYNRSSNVFFISASNAQRKLLPNLNYLSTIYHGVEPKVFSFNGSGGESILWAGRAIPEKGIHHVVEVAKKTNRNANLFGIPRKEHQAWLQRTVLDKLGYRNVAIKTFDGTYGWREMAPFDAIMVTAGAPDIPKPLVDQLKPGGRMVIPVGEQFSQTLLKVVKTPEGTVTEKSIPCVFVPLVGAHGWKE